MRKGQYVGIDFGTTNTAVVCVQEDEHGRKVTLLGENGEFPFSSIVALPRENGAIQFGRKVRNQRIELSDKYEIYTSMKSYLGKKRNGDELCFVVGERRYFPKEIVSAFLRHIKESTLQQHGIDIEEASFSFPIDFSPEARRALREAAEDAGITVKGFVGESTAAYIANRSEGKAFSRVMVIDWGGGTLDLSVLKLTGTSIHEEAVWGDSIGGDDIDRELAVRLHGRIAAQSGISGDKFEDMSPAERDQMILKCEEAKISISDDGEAYPLTVSNYGVYGKKNIMVTVEQFNEIVEPLIKSRVLKAINEVLNKAGGLTPSSIDAVVVVGGSSNLRLFERVVSNIFRNAKMILPKKSQWSTATGAALLQRIGGNFRLSDCVGVKLSNEFIFPILPVGHRIGKKTDVITFALVEDAKDAHFIFTDSSGRIYVMLIVPTKGFLQEALELTAEIGEDQIARITIINRYFSLHNPNRTTTVEITKLRFYYELGVLGESD